ncbi:carbohydrate ABC transporter permease [Treponema sp. Marseille-Q4132]|uniref:carbohydrate ABC transporter permease n=1 Tax=Treponema sp. Marseille-Q4132 TaxID=2766701 RepID=UPI001652DC69|nr:carbohydrate ABC transporter permease [Treponema sp. Marseille-Q4132]QNL96408.1 carbohydrate ABC transporter permease [Treponema sp. Marseille-Q4132]
MNTEKRRAVSIFITAIRYVILSLLAFTTLFPLVWMLYSSFKSNPEIIQSSIALPKKLHFENYINAWNTANIGKYFFNSVFVTIVSIVFVVIVGSMAAYVLAKFKFRGRHVIMMLFTIGMLIPLQAVLVPLFSQMKNLHLLNTLKSLIIVYTAFALPLAIFLLESFMQAFPDSIIEAALIDGASVPRIFFTIVMPMAHPTIATVIILSFLNNWKEFSFALVFINSEAKKTLPLGLYNFLGAYTADYAGLMAALVIATIPTFALYILLQNQVINGMTAGAVKG